MVIERKVTIRQGGSKEKENGGLECETGARGTQRERRSGKEVPGRTEVQREKERQGLRRCLNTSRGALCTSSGRAFHACAHQTFSVILKDIIIEGKRGGQQALATRQVSS